MGDEKTGRENNETDLQREVLALVLVEHPVPHSLTDLQRVLGRHSEVEAAVEALVGCGLLRRDGPNVLPSPAAVRFNRIEPIEPPRWS